MPYIKNITVTDVVEPAISGDPLLRNVDLPLRRVYHPLGFSIEVITNSDEVVVAAEESWGRLRRAFSEPALQLRIVLGEGRSGLCPTAPVYRAQRNLLSIVADSRNFAVCDRDQGFAFAWVDGDAIEHPSYLRYHFLEPLALSMLSSSYVVPLHAACVELAGKGVLLCGNSGAGKSSLAFACARAGWKYISDDASYLVRKGSGRVVAGNSHQVRLRPSAGELFPDVKGFSPTPRTAGKPSIEIPTALLPYVTTASHSTVEYIIFLNRIESSAPELAPFPKDVAMQWASQSPAATGDSDEVQAASLRTLLNAQLLELRYSGLEGAVKCLEKLIHGGSE
jgi:HPr Serine kinase C-terminal domain